MRLGASTLLIVLVVIRGENIAELACRHGSIRADEELLPLSHCDASLLADGRVRASCRVLVSAPPELWFIPSDPEVMTLEEELVSDAPADENITCLSLTKTTVKKWDDFPPDMKSSYQRFEEHPQGWTGPIEVYSLMVFIKQCELDITFQKPVIIAVANCSKSQISEHSVDCSISGIMNFFINYNAFPNISKSVPAIISKLVLSLGLVKDWNLAHVAVKVVNVAFAESVKSIPSEPIRIIAFLRIAHVIYYRCNFKQIKRNDIAHMRYMKQLDFFYAPITFVHPEAFDLIPDLQGISLEGSKLGSVPRAIFSLRRLRRLNMAAIRVLTNVTFQFCPEPCLQMRSVKEFILAGTSLKKLRDRQLCAFPSLIFLDLNDCTIEEIEGSPFICLEGLRELRLHSNHITSVSEAAYKGLKRLEILDLRTNSLSLLSGPAVFGNLESLKSLYLSSNKVHTLKPPVKATSVRLIDLSDNLISKWRSPFFSLMNRLGTLNLSSNTMFTIDDSMLNDLRNIGTVDVVNNSWDCGSCLLRNLQILLNSSARASAGFTLCRGPEIYADLKADAVQWNEADCTTLDLYAVVGVPLILTVLVMSVISYGLYAKRWYLMYALLYLRVRIRTYKRQSQGDGRFLWDAFLCYHISDASWVNNVLLARLESSPTHFRICIAERDFIPGIPIAENICRCISQSQISLFVVSEGFCRSHWCMFELTLAQHRLFESERDDHIVFIQKGRIDESEMGFMLSFLTRCRTYINVPPPGSDERLQNLFWLKLRAAFHP